MNYNVKKDYIENLIKNSNNDNANLSYNPEVISKYVHDNVMKQYALDIMSDEISEAHREGFIHVHDLEYYALRPNCFNYDLRFFIRNGLVIDGKGVDGSVAAPARSLEVLLNHLLQVFMAGAQVFSGGQGLANFNTFLAPLCQGRSYYDIKQCIQGFIFNCNMSLVSKGGQIIFSSVGLDMSVPEHLKDSPAVTFEGETIGVYADYQREADMIFKAFLEVLNEKDASGQWHRFPNTLINIQSGDLDEYKGTCKVLHELGANNPTLYYTNQSNYVKTIMGCFSGDTCLWVKINGELQYISFNEIDKLLNANMGVTPVNNIEVLTINDDKKIIWKKAKNFIKNEPMDLFEVKLTGNRSFICDENHTMITPALYKKSIFDCKNHLKTIGIHREDVTPNKRAALYGFYCGDGKKCDDFGRGFANLMLLKPDKIEYARDLLVSLNVDFKEKIVHHSRDNVDYTIFYFSANEIIEPNLLDINDCAGLLEGMLSSDGYVRLNKGGFNRTSLSAEFVNTDLEISRLFKFACFNLGIKFSSRLIQPSKNQKNRLPFERVYLSCNYESVNILKQLNLRKKQKVLCDGVVNDFRHVDEVVSDKIKEITLLNESDYTYCFEVNDRIIIGSDFILTGQCRTALPDNFTGVYDLDCLNTGNFAYTTLNLPLLALESNGDVDKFYELLDKYCDIARDGLLNRRELVKDIIYIKHMSDFLLQRDKVTGIPLYDIDRTTITLGFCGLYECMQILNYGFGEDIIQFMNAKTNSYKLEDGLRWSVIGSPAESASHRFAMIIKDKYLEVELNGTEGNYYLTNSSHIPVNHESDIVSHIRNADKYHPLTKAGNICHIWLGETYHDPIAIWKLNKKILETNTNFWAFTNDFTYCNSCHNTFNEALDKCSVCGSEDLTVFSRITGYYVPVNNWNNGKKAEFNDRFRHMSI